MDYLSKMVDGFEIRFYKNSDGLFTGRLFKNNKPVSIKIKNDKGEALHMESGSKTSIIKKLKNAINSFNTGNAKIVDVPNQVEANKFTDGDIIIEKETNVVLIGDIIYIFEANHPYDKTYKVLKFIKSNEDKALEIEFSDLDKKHVDSNYISIGNDKSIKETYIGIMRKKDQIVKSVENIETTLTKSIEILNKTNEDFYKDLLIQIHKSDASEFEKDKYIEFISAAYNNKEKTK